MKRRPDSHLQKRASKVSEFLSGFPLLLQGHQKVSLLFFGNTRVSKLPRCCTRLIKPEVDPISQLFDEFFQGKWLVLVASGPRAWRGRDALPRVRRCMSGNRRSPFSLNSHLLVRFVQA